MLVTNWLRGLSALSKRTRRPRRSKRRRLPQTPAAVEALEQRVMLTIDTEPDTCPTTSAAHEFV